MSHWWKDSLTQSWFNLKWAFGIIHSISVLIIAHFPHTILWGSGDAFFCDLKQLSVWPLSSNLGSLSPTSSFWFPSTYKRSCSLLSFFCLSLAHLPRFFDLWHFALGAGVVINSYIQQKWPQYVSQRSSIQQENNPEKTQLNPASWSCCLYN